MPEYSPLLTYARSIKAFGPDVQQVDVGSQATPLAEDFLAVLQGQLSSDAFGTGVGPLQREAGTALRQFIESLQSGQGGVSAGSEKLIAGLTAGSEARTERGVGDLREQGGITGQRFGSSLATGEALLRSESSASLDQLIGGIMESGRQFDTDLLLQSIAQLFGQGQANIDPFMQFAGMGIFPDETIVSPSTFTQIADAAAGFADPIAQGIEYLGRDGPRPPGPGSGRPVSGGPGDFPPTFDT